MQNTLANFIGVFSLVRDDRGFQVNPLCRHDITSPFPPSGNGGYVRNLDVLLLSFKLNSVSIPTHELIGSSTFCSTLLKTHISVQ